MTEQTILKFFAEKGLSVGAEDDLFKGGYVNSLFALEIVTYLEDAFKIRIKNRDITEDNFRTVRSIAGVVEKCLKNK